MLTYKEEDASSPSEETKVPFEEHSPPPPHDEVSVSTPEASVPPPPPGPTNVDTDDLLVSFLMLHSLTS